ncbi:hypothetical protein FNV43_RR18505 [Rhamnella rubrinervis]|uniref:U1 small nuclear ribonucleoprotein 70 kDa n=1 Tax=Rhamnella rubrinervis TaxID=2594499 RepID=A0A8K0DZ45_9ROSA|nr:hypothetical protein FNV43_RR18505 [Rhamnella rubrinervis]
MPPTPTPSRRQRSSPALPPPAAACIRFLLRLPSPQPRHLLICFSSSMSSSEPGAASPFLSLLRCLHSTLWAPILGFAGFITSLGSLIECLRCGIAQFVSKFARKDPEYALPVQKGETPIRYSLELIITGLATICSLQFSSWNINMSYSFEDILKCNYETAESRIKREFDVYGPVKRVRFVNDKETNKPRGYAFIEYMHTRDMKAAYKQADGRKIEGRRVLVDVERGRTVPNWRPCRLGGGLGTTRVGGEEVNQRYSSSTNILGGVESWGMLENLDSHKGQLKF